MNLIFSRRFPVVMSLIAEFLLIVIAMRLGLVVLVHLGLGPGAPPPVWKLNLNAAIFAVLGLLSFYFTGLYDFAERRLSLRQMGMAVLGAFTMASLVLWGLLYFLVPSLEMGRTEFVISLCLAIAFVTAWRVSLFWLMREEQFAERVLIVGTDEKAIDIAREILHRRNVGYRVVGFLDDDPSLQGVSLINPRVIGTTRQTRELALQHGATRVVVAPGDFRGRVSMDALLETKYAGIPVQEGSSYYEHLTGKIMVEGLRKSWLIFSDGFVPTREVLLVKRTLDFVVGLAGLVLASPLMVLVALLVRLDSPGPVFFRQERVGRNGRLFTLWKFRSMRTDAEADGARWAVKGDPRVTRVGRFIRATRLDELPQLWNVLAGHMSLVGPRPERAMFVRQLTEKCPFYEQRLMVRPGLTGWAQIKAPYASSFEESIEKLKYDLYYIKNLSLLFDLSILLSTARIVLLGRGAR